MSGHPNSEKAIQDNLATSTKVAKNLEANHFISQVDADDTINVRPA